MSLQSREDILRGKKGNQPTCAKREKGRTRESSNYRLLGVREKRRGRIVFTDFKSRGAACNQEKPESPTPY